MSPNTYASDMDNLQPIEKVAPLELFLQIAGTLESDFLVDMTFESQGLASWVEHQREGHLLLLRDALLKVNDLDEPAHKTTFKSAALKILDRYPADEAVREAFTKVYGDLGSIRRRAAAAIPKRVPAAALSTLSPSVEVPASINDVTDRPPRIVLLPPAASTHPAAIYATALIEDVTVGLCAFRSVSVLAPYTAAQISQRTDKPLAYERYSISYVLDTRLMEEGSGCSLFAQLIFFGSDEIIWAERFDVSDASLMHSRRELAIRIASAISDQIIGNEFQRIFFEENGTAYRNFLLGQHTLNRLDLPQVRRARKHFREALRENGHFAPALSGVARSFFFEWLLTARGDSELLTTAEQHAKDAIAANTSLAAGYRELGVVKLYQRRYDESIEFLQQAESLSPHYANVIASHADTLVQASRPGEGLEKIKLALDLNPLAPDEYFWTAAGASYSLGEYEQALGYIDQMKDKLPADRLAAASWGMLGNTRKAKQFVSRTFEVHPGFDLEKWMAIVPFKEDWQKKHYFEGLRKAGFR
ncbi:MULTISPECIES: hypothetical protein [unclassified Sinorhizobium]|uniref:hypothetical protein n=1 Tax=unclassified Sinorhizobium TaxID=2613772 RepID=UPI0035261570